MEKCCRISNHSILLAMLCPQSVANRLSNFSDRWKILSFGLWKASFCDWWVLFNVFNYLHLLVYDASAKLSSGILNGNVNQYGDFDMCLDVVTPSHNFKSQYCLAHIQPKVSSDYHYLNYLRTLSLSFEAYKSNFEDVSYAVLKRCSITSTVKFVLRSRVTLFRKLHKSTGLFAFRLFALTRKSSSFWRKN